MRRRAPASPSLLSRLTAHSQSRPLLYHPAARTSHRPAVSGGMVQKATQKGAAAGAAKCKKKKKNWSTEPIYTFWRAHHAYYSAPPRKLDVEE